MCFEIYDLNGILQDAVSHISFYLRIDVFLYFNDIIGYRSFSSLLILHSYSLFLRTVFR